MYQCNKNFIDELFYFKKILFDNIYLFWDKTLLVFVDSMPCFMSGDLCLGQQVSLFFLAKKSITLYFFGSSSFL